MIVKNKTMLINSDSIFKDDALDRKVLIEDLSEIISSTYEPLVFALNAPWGTGKTTFVKMWKSYLKTNKKINSLYFSAWEDDFSNEPLIAILGELNSYISENFSSSSDIEDKFDNAINVGGKILKRGLPAFIKGMTGGILDVDSGYEAAIGAMTEETTKALIQQYSKEKELTTKFKETMNELLNTMDKEKPFIIFIDELDRCRPLYAIELLERIKHLFGIDNLIFILSIDKLQLSESIKSQYGNIDTNNYLRRFIDIEYKLQKGNIEKYCEVLYKQFDLEGILKSKEIKLEFGDFDHLNTLKRLVKVFDTSLRELEQIFLKLNIIFKTIQPRLYETHFRVFVFFEMLKSYDTNLYYEAIKGNSKEKLRELFSQYKTSEYRDISIVFDTIIDAIGLDDEQYNVLIKDLEEKLQKNQDTSSNDYRKLDRHINILKHSPSGSFGDYRLNKAIETVIKKLEFTDRFVFDSAS